MTRRAPATLETANDVMDEPDLLRARLEQDGYLFLRAVLDRDSIERVREDVTGILREQGLVEPAGAEPLWSGAGIDVVDDGPLYDLESVAALSEGPARGVADLVHGEPAFMLKGPNLRYSVPEDTAHVTPAHQDRYFIRGGGDFRTLWIPLMPVPREVGGLAIAAGSHRRGLLEHVEQPDVYSVGFRDRKQRGVDLDALGDPFLTADYLPGDVLVLLDLTVHWALPNRSDRVRLSIDTRSQPARQPRTFQMERTIPELRSYRADVKRLALEAGASEELAEELIVEMMRRGSPATREAALAVRADIAGRSTGG